MPASAVTRSNKITYGGFVVGAGTSYHLHGVHIVEQDYTSLTVEFQVFCHNDTLATFVSDCTALEAAFRAPNGDLKIELGASTYLDVTQAGNTGMLAQPRIEKAGEDADSNNSRIYDVSVRIVLPADESGKDGRRSASVSVTEDGAEILTLDITADYTALSGNDALAQAQSAFPTYVTAQQAAVDATATWDELTGRTYTYDSDDKICTARASYRSLVANETTAGLNSTTLQGVEMAVRTTTSASQVDSGSGAKPLLEILVSFSCRVRSSQSTDLRSVWENTVRPHMIAQARSLSGANTVAAISQRPFLDTQSNSIQATMRFVARGASSVIASATVLAKDEVLPVTFVPVLDGDPYARDEHFRPGSRTAVVSSSVAEVGGGSANPFSILDSFGS